MIRDEFKVHILNPDGIARAQDLAYHFTNFLNTVERRRSSLKKAMASQSQNQAEPKATFVSTGPFDRPDR